MIEAILVTTGSLYLLYNAYNIKYKHIIRKNDNALTNGKTIVNIDGYFFFIDVADRHMKSPAFFLYW